MDEAPSSEVEELATPTGLEPVISAVTGRRVNHYTKGPHSNGSKPPVVSESFTSLLPNPEAEKPQGIQTRVHSRNVSVPDSEPWDQWKARAAHRHLVNNELEVQHKVYSVIDAMMAGLELSQSEALRLRGVLRDHFYNEVSRQSLELSYSVLP